MLIREMQIDDLDALSKLYLDCRIATFDWWQADEFKLGEFEKSTEGETVIVAEMNNEILGFCSIWEDNFIHNLFVDVNIQNKGIGKALLEYAFNNLIKKPARLKCTVQNNKACAFYEKNGWQIEKTSSEGAKELYHVYIMK